MALDELRQVKLDKLAKLQDLGIDPYPAKTERTHSIIQALEDFEKLSASEEIIVLAGRILSIRAHGGSIFFDIFDGTARIQGYIKEDVLGEKEFSQFNDLYDLGDFIELTGSLFRTKKDEKTLQVKKFKILAKSLLPMPEKWHGLQDSEDRLRKRYLDVIMDPAQREIFIKKSRFWQSTREFLLREGGLEMETPILEQVPGGADAEPFITHMNALDIDLYLRISPELSLKKMNVAGFDKIFEIGRIFRNEGIDREHLQDYTQMEMYWSYIDYIKLMEIVERLVKFVINETLGSMKHSYQNQKINWDSSWPRIDYYEVFKKYTDIDLASVTDEELKNYAEHIGVDTEEHFGRGRLIDVIFKKKCRPHLIEPSFLVLPPVDIEPLAKRYLKDPNRVERFQIVACGSELGKGFSELNDPIDQASRFQEQAKLREEGDKEAQFMNKEFVEALEYGMPPVAGFAYSERLFTFIMDKPIRETVFFPIMKPKNEDK